MVSSSNVRDIPQVRFKMNESEILANIRTVRTSQLELAYCAFGKPDGWPCILNHGFPYDIHCYSQCIKPLADAGAFVVVPYLRGYGMTHFLSDDTLRSGEQAVLANDLLELMNALSIERAVLAGYDWGGRAACIVAALWPSRVTGLVSGNSYNIQNIQLAMQPDTPEQEFRFWYQYYFHSERGQRGLAKDRRGIAHLLWSKWSPSWKFTDEEFERTAVSFDNPDFVEVVIHSYRHRFGLAEGDPSVAHIEAELEAQPDIPVASLCIDGTDNGVSTSTSHHSSKFTGPYKYREFKDAGHNLPQERPLDWVQAILDVRELGRE